jgi:hypothetical protein
LIDILRERVFPLTDAPRHEELPQRRFKKRPHAATLYRWAKKGLRGVRLETIRVGGTLCTSTAALQRFFDALSQTDQRSAEPVKLSQKRVAGRIDQKLDEAGF